MTIQDVFTKKWCLLTWCFDHLSSHWFLSNLIFSFNTMSVLFLSHEIYSTPTPALAHSFLFQLWSWNVTPTLLQQHYFWAFSARLPAFCMSFWDCPNLPRTTPKNKKRRTEIKRKPRSWSWGAGADFPHAPNSDWGNQPSCIKVQHNLPQGISAPDDRWSGDISQHRLQVYGTIFFQY